MFERGVWLVTIGDMIDPPTTFSRDRRGRKGYKINLSDFHALCEANYHFLLRLFPGYEQAVRQIFEAGEGVVRLEVTGRDRYTTDLRLFCQGLASAAFCNINLDLRLYHDASMAEVVNYHPSLRFEASYIYPNPKMVQRDEKYQRNLFLFELLGYCIENGRSISNPDIDVINIHPNSDTV